MGKNKRKTKTKIITKKVINPIEEDEDINLDDLINVEDIPQTINPIEEEVRETLIEETTDITTETKELLTKEMVTISDKDIKIVKEKINDLFDFKLNLKFEENIEISKRIYKKHKFEINESDFLIKFSYFLLSRNIIENQITLRQIAKFNRIQLNYNIDAIKLDFFKMK